MNPLRSHEAVMQRIFLVGSPRSGTTLYQRLVSAHGRLTTFPESHFFWHLCGDGRWRRALRLARREEVRERLLDFLEESGEEALAPRVVECSAFFYGGWIELFVQLLDAIAARRGVEGWLEKTPMHLHYLDLVEAHLADARVLHIVRPAEQVVASLRRVTARHPEAWGGPRTVEENVDRWLFDVGRHREYLDAPGHFFVLYQELVEAPERTVRRTCGFLGLPFEPDMLTPGRRDDAILEDEPWKTGAEKPISTSERTSVDEVLSEEERAYVEDRTSSVDLSAFSGG